jgi:peptide deformylase
MFGDPITVEGTATLARCLEHETDHLDGVLFIDRLELDARKVALRALLEATWWGESAPVVKVSPHQTRGLAL